MRRSIALLLLVCVSAGAEGGPIQFGLRLDSVSSLQWDATTLFLESDRRYATRLSGGEILEVWPGPSRGTFMVHTTKGLGILIGADIVLAGRPQAPGAILRSSRPDVLWVGFTAGTPAEPRARVREWRAGGLGRELLDLPGTLVDFDTASDGAIAVLLKSGLPLLVRSSGPALTLPLPPGLAQPVRIMLTTQGTELSLVCVGALCRKELAGGDWRCQRFDPGTQAIVRHAFNGRPRVETRLAP